MAAAVYRDSVNYLTIGGVNASSGTATTTVVYPVIQLPSVALNTLFTMRSTGWVIGCAGVVANNSDIETPPALMTNRVNLAGAGAREISIHDTNAVVTDWAATNFTQSQSAAYHTAMAEIMDTGIPKASAGFGHILGC